jgi:hypothetical protein
MFEVDLQHVLQEIWVDEQLYQHQIQAYMVTFPNFQYIPPLFNLKSPPNSLYNQVSFSGIQLDSPLGEKNKRCQYLLLYTHQQNPKVVVFFLTLNQFYKGGFGGSKSP